MSIESSGALSIRGLKRCTSPVLPWGSLFEDVQASSLYDFERLLSAHAVGMGGSDDWVEVARYYGRFLVYPSVSVILLALAGLHFAGGYSRSVLANE